MIAAHVRRLFVCLLALTAAVRGAAADWRDAHRPAGDAWRSLPQHFIFNNGLEPETLDIHTMTGIAEFRIADALFEGLTTRDPKTLEIRPGVAESWEVSEDQLVYTFRLRGDARWSDGKALTARDFVASWRRALTAATGNSYANLFMAIRGAEAYLKGAEQDFGRVGVSAPDERTLRVELHRPCGYFLELTGFPTFHPLRTDAVAEHGEQWTQPGKLIGNGAFTLAEWSPRQRIVLRRSETYWDRAFVKLESVTILPLDDMNTAYQMYLKGEMQWMSGIPLARLEEVRLHPDYYVAPYFGTYFYRFNCTRPPFDDARVRRALSMATDRREITEFILKAGQKPVSTLCPPIAGYEPREGFGLNREAALKLLAEAGYGPGGKPFPAVEILYNTSEGHKLVAEAIAEQWKRSLGIATTSRNTEWKTFLSDMKDLNYQICRASWVGDYGDPSTFYNIFAGEDGNNRTGWKHPDYDRMVQEAENDTDPARRRALFQRMDTLLTQEECPILPIYRYTTQGFLSGAVRGWHENIRDEHPLKYIWLEPE
jgi:oligopeptide transport system substrate-binding protein